jgi:hypothetical protein
LIARSGYHRNVLYYLMAIVSLMGGGCAIAAHVASFAIDVNNDAWHLTLSIGMLTAFIVASLLFFPFRTGARDDEISPDESPWRYVPWWMRLPPGLLVLYGALGLFVQAPGVTEFSVEHMTPILARWASVLEAAFFLVAAAMFYGARARRKAEVFR